MSKLKMKYGMSFFINEGGCLPKKELVISGKGKKVMVEENVNDIFKARLNLIIKANLNASPSFRPLVGRINSVNAI